MRGMMTKKSPATMYDRCSHSDQQVGTSPQQNNAQGKHYYWLDTTHGDRSGCPHHGNTSDQQQTDHRVGHDAHQSNPANSLDR